MSVGADLGGRGDDGGGMDSGSVGGRFVEEIEGAGEGEVRIGDAQGGGADRLECRLDEDCGRLGGAGERDVPGVGDEGELAGTGVFEAGCGGDFEVWVALEGCV